MPAFSAPGQVLPALADEAYARQVAKAIWPWAEDKRWNPTTGRATSPIGKEMWILGTAPFVAILVVKADETGPRLQVPLTGSGASPVIARAGGLNLRDGAVEPSFWEAWVRLALPPGQDRDDLLRAAHRVHPLGVEQSNTSVLLEGGPHPYIAKVFRVLHRGAHPEVEVPSALTGQGWRGVPRVVASWNLPRRGRHLPECSAVISDAIPDAQDGFELLKLMARAGETAHADCYRLGELTAQMHQLLAQSFGVGEPLPGRELERRILKSLSALEKEDVPGLDPSVLEKLSKKVEAAHVADSSIPTSRIHGDLHLGQSLRGAGGSWFFIDFEGEPLKDISERNALDNPLRDVAGMLRSLDYAAQGATDATSQQAWRQSAQRSFLDGYTATTPLTEEEMQLLDLLQLEKALYEVEYERLFRPTYLRVPLGALSQLAEQPLK